MLPLPSIDVNSRSGEHPHSRLCEIAGHERNAPEASSRADAVVLTDSAKSLSRATARAKASDGIDSAKVEKLKAAINDGSYKINYESVASKLIDSEDELSSIFG